MFERKWVQPVLTAKPEIVLIVRIGAGMSTMSGTCLAVWIGAAVCGRTTAYFS